MSNYYQVCNECCWMLGLEINSFITSRCYRKFCDICEYSTNDDLSSIIKATVDDAIVKHKKKA